jgi:hypothetical protein
MMIIKFMLICHTLLIKLKVVLLMIVLALGMVLWMF